MNLVSIDSSRQSPSTERIILSNPSVPIDPQSSEVFPTQFSTTAQRYSLAFLLFRRPHFQLLRCVRRSLFVFRLWKPSSHKRGEISHSHVYQSSDESNLLNPHSLQLSVDLYLALKLCCEVLRLFEDARLLLLWACHIVSSAILSIVRELNSQPLSSSTCLTHSSSCIGYVQGCVNVSSFSLQLIALPLMYVLYVTKPRMLQQN
jgi:hypothetical protein